MSALTKSAAAMLTTQAFLRHSGTESGRDKLAAYGSKFIRDHLREEGFARKIMEAETVSPDECQVSTSHDTLVKIEEVEPNSRAMAISFRGAPEARYISAPRFEIAFFSISSEIFEKVEQELLAYRMPITKVIEDNSVKDLQEIEDREFVVHLESAIEFMQTAVNGGAVAFNAVNVNAGAVLGGLDLNAAGTERGAKIKGSLALAAGLNNFALHPVQRVDFINLANVMIDKRLQPERVLITERDWNNILTWTVEDQGDKIQSETTVDGYKYSTVMGLKFVRTIKNGILRPGNIYLFAAPEFFGYFYLLNDVKFYIDKNANRIQWQCWEDIGMGFGNISAVAKLELYGGSVTPTVETAGFAVAVPLDEDNLEITNNKVASGGVFPEVFIY